MPALRFLGSAILEDDRGHVEGPAAHRHPLGLLALLATAPSRTLSRGKLVGLLWPDTDDATGRNRLTTCIYHLRRALGDSALVSVRGDLRLDDQVVSCDVWSFEESLAHGDWIGAVRTYGGPFLDGFRIGGSVGFEHRVDRERDRLHRSYGRALEELAEEAEARGDLRGATRWWRDRAAEDPYDSRVALRLMAALVESGNPAGALEVGRAHVRWLEDELGTPSPPEVDRMIRSLAPARTGPVQPTPDPRRHPVARSSSWVPPARPAPAPGPAPAAHRTGADRPADRSGPALPRAGRSGGDRPAGSIVAGALVGLAALAAAVVAASLGEREPARDAAAPNRTAAIELYLQGMTLDHAGPLTRAGHDRKVELFRRAVELDPELAAAWARLADAYVERSWRGPAASIWTDSARTAAERAIEIDPALADAYVQIGDTYWGVRDGVEKQLAVYRTALELQPTHPEAINNLATLLFFQGRWAEAMGVLHQAHRLSPEAPKPMAGLARFHARLGRDDLADSWLARAREQGHSTVATAFEISLFQRGDVRRARELLPRLTEREGVRPQRRRGALALYEGDWHEARRHYQALYPGTEWGSHLYGGLLWAPLGLAHALDRVGDREAARAIAREVLAQGEAGGAGTYSGENRQAVASLILGDTTAALDWLDRAVDAGYRDVRMLQTVPTLEALRPHPRFRRLVGRLEDLLRRERDRLDPGTPLESWTSRGPDRRS